MFLTRDVWTRDSKKRGHNPNEHRIAGHNSELVVTERYRNLIVRIAGYSAYFVDLSPSQQAEIIACTERDGLSHAETRRGEAWDRL